jgi:hypothetical protein
MNHPIILRVQTNNALEQIEIPVIHKQILHGKAIHDREYKSSQGHNVLSEIISSGEDYCNKQHWEQSQIQRETQRR